MNSAGFETVILDVDSTLCGIEGIDWLAGQRGDAVSLRVADLTDRAMRGDIPLDDVYGERLKLVRPSRALVNALSKEYLAAIAPHAASAVRVLHQTGRRVVLMSGGIREAILLVAAVVGIPEDEVHAVSVQFDAHGEYAGFDAQSPLTTATGKRTVAESLTLTRRVLAVGDGATDLAMRPAVDAFAAFTGFVRRDAVVASADFVLESFDQLVEIVLA
ncbi:MAG: HAD-IB family phosphatase [bacterium]